MAQTGNKISLNPDPVFIKQELNRLDQSIPNLIGIMEQINDPKYIPVVDLLKTMSN
jgi:dihydroorotase